ncbi:MAG: hypothetical protein VYC39_11105 [Myxococcota bacterium]|nr:hypothetical protein [Myxococcota bacterium]
MLAADGEPKALVTNSASRLTKMRSVEWLGQTVASLAWIVSVFTYGIKENGDWLQLLAASAWFIANVAAVWSTDSNSQD